MGNQGLTLALNVCLIENAGNGSLSSERQQCHVKPTGNPSCLEINDTIRSVSEKGAMSV